MLGVLSCTTLRTGGFNPHLQVIWAHPCLWLIYKQIVDPKVHSTYSTHYESWIGHCLPLMGSMIWEVDRDIMGISWGYNDWIYTWLVVDLPL